MHRYFVELPFTTETGASVVAVHAGFQPGKHVFSLNSPLPFILLHLSYLDTVFTYKLDVPLEAQQPFNMMNMRNLGTYYFHTCFNFLFLFFVVVIKFNIYFR